MERDRSDIIHRFSHGDESAFRSIYEYYAPLLRYYAAKYLPDAESREDVIQEAFVLLWKKRKGFYLEASIKAYLFRVTQSMSLNILKRRRVADRYMAAVPGMTEVETFLDDMFEAELFGEIARVFAELSPATRRVYELSLKGMSHQEIAAELDIAVNTIKKHKNLANHHMRRRLKGVR